ncbi:hypothetical protein EDD18DRAFT_1243432 [Armillaria luteobubalina]|uniref:Wax synthase domain-containing protein n=1 Tax=Armillaria luteobubalina TaxID=153913 RepID=A0AA39QKP3_9AGAR|nr:hypothetical protein EDD18DRAFT_1243432 [Armillaria luteobubalina]
MSHLFQELGAGAYQAFRTIIPEPHNRIPISLDAIPSILVSYVPFLFMAFLARQENTYIIRLLLLPTVITASIGTSFRYYWTIPMMNTCNWGSCLSAFVIIGKALDYAFQKEGMLRVDEVRPGQYKGKATANGSANGHINPPVGGRSITPWLTDVVQLTTSMRGISWKYGQETYVPKETRPLDRGPFVNATLLAMLKNFFIMDILEFILKLFPGVGSVFGGSMFYYSLPPLPRYAVSTFIHILSGSCLLAGFEAIYQLVTLVAVGICDDSPLAWPPILDSPWLSESMHELWSKRWHQLLRQTFMVYGGYPGKWIAGDFGMVVGIFIASGLYHELSMYAMGRGLDSAPVIFFALQAPILVIERFWRRITGRRVGGWYGRLWVYFVMFVLAQPMINSWHRRGLAGGLILPPFMSPTRLLVSIFARFINPLE